MKKKSCLKGWLFNATKDGWLSLNDMGFFKVTNK
jgi:hypothetical protein